MTKMRGYMEIPQPFVAAVMAFGRSLWELKRGK
jgi:hypothetical protein